jgi:hypothetical protein
MPYVRRPFNPLTPTPNQVVNELNQANENFDILAQVFLNNDPTTRVLKSDIYTFRRVNLTEATSDYELQVGEEAYYVWDTTRGTFLPLRIRVSGALYEMIIITPNRAYGRIDIFLLPNNLTYSSAFRRTVILPHNDSYVFNWKDNPNSIVYEQVGAGGMLISLLQTTTTSKGELHHIVAHSFSFSYAYHLQIAHRWNDTTTVWSSLGTLVIENPNGVVYVLVRRLI